MSSPATNLEPFYVVDTHALIWYLLNDKKLSSRAKTIFQAAEQNQAILIVSAIVMAELYFANVKNRWFQGKRMKIFSRFNKGHGVSQGRNALRLDRKIICTEPL
jgi:predicted nucleic acid-binding protein